MAAEKGIWKVITASSVGTLIEWYDFYIFGSLSTIIAQKFFPDVNPTAALLSTLATFAAGVEVFGFRLHLQVELLKVAGHRGDHQVLYLELYFRVCGV